MSKLFVVVLLGFVTCGVALAQTQSVTERKEATRPPGTRQSQTTSAPERPSISVPTAPPGIERAAPQTPPGTASRPERNIIVAPGTSPENPSPPLPPEQPGAAEGVGSVPLSSLLKPRAVPPLPSLVRLGVSNDRVVPLTLDAAVRLALENNNDIEIARGDVRRTESSLLSFEAVYDPVFSFNPQIVNRVTPIASALGGSDRSGTVTTNDLNFDAAVSKPFRTGGGQYQFFFNNTRESTSSTFSQLNPFYSSNSGVTFSQPLLRNRAIDLDRRAIRVQRKQLQQSDADFRRITTATIADVGRAYWDLVFALRDQQNRTSNLQLARELFRQTEQRIEAGSSAPFERAEIETELATRESELIASAQNVSGAEVALKLLILRNPLAPEWSAVLVPVDTPSFESAPVNLDDVLREARTNRPELARLRTQAEISDIDLLYFKNQMRPRVDIEATLSTTGLAGSPVIPTGTINGDTPASGTGGQIPLIGGDANTNANAFLLAQLNQLRAGAGLAPADVPLVTTETRALPENLTGGYGRTLRNLIGLGTRNVVVGVRIEVPFRNRRAQAELATARIERSQLEALQAKQEQIIEAEVRLTAQAVETARQRVLVARGARRGAELQLEGERKLYEVGRSTTFLLFQRENTLTNVRNLELRAETDYNKALASLQQATATSLTAYNIFLETSAGR
jgi:HAE1 family hydrophobic/amphiphilic exporter-1